MLKKLKMKFKKIGCLWKRVAAVVRDIEMLPTSDSGGVLNASAEGGVLNAAAEGGVLNAAAEGGVLNAAAEGGVLNAAAEGGVLNVAAEDVVLNVVDGAVGGNLHLSSSSAVTNSSFSFDDVSEHDIHKIGVIISNKPCIKRKILQIMEEEFEMSSPTTKIMELMIPFNGALLLNMFDKVKTETNSQFVLYTSMGLSITAICTSIASFYIEPPKKKQASRRISVIATFSSLLLYGCSFFFEHNNVMIPAIVFPVVAVAIFWFVMSR